MSRFLDKCMTTRMGKEYSFHLIASVSSHWLGSLDQRGFNAVSWLDSWLWTFSWLTMSPWIDPTIESPSGQNGLILTVHALGFSMDGGSIPSLVLFSILSLAAAAKRTHLVLLCPLLYYCREASDFRCSTIVLRTLQFEKTLKGGQIETS